MGGGESLAESLEGFAGDEGDGQRSPSETSWLLEEPCFANAVAERTETLASRTVLPIPTDRNTDH